MRRKRLPGKERTARSLVGLVAVISFLLAFFPGSVMASNPAASSTGVVCQLEMVVHDTIASHVECGPSSGTATCSSHVGCVSIAVPTESGLVVAPVSALWTPAAADDPVGYGPFVSTPPPITFA